MRTGPIISLDREGVGEAVILCGNEPHREAFLRRDGIQRARSRVAVPPRHTAASSHGAVIAALAYTLVPVVAFHEAGGELTSALVPILLSHGFQLTMTPDYTDILDQATEVDNGYQLTVAGAGYLTLNVGRETIHAEWLDVTSSASVLIIGGDNLLTTETRLDLDAAARLGTLVIGFVPVKS